MKFEENVEKKEREALFNERKRKYESNHYENGERYKLCYSFEDKEKQIEKSSKLFEYTFNLYKLADYINNFVDNSKESNEGFFDTEKLLRFISSHFDEDFEEELKYWKQKFNFNN